MELASHLGDTVTYVSAVPAAVSVIGALLAVACAVSLSAASVRGQPGQAAPAFLLVLLGFAMVAMLPVIPFLPLLSQAGPRPEGSRLAAVALWQAMLLDTAPAVMTGAVAVIALAFRSARTDVRGGNVAFVGLALSGLLSLVGLAHATWLATQGPVPTIAHVGGPRMHVGHTRPVEAQLLGAEPGKWELELPPPVTPTAPGPLRVAVQTRSGPIRLVSTRVLQVGEDRVDPRLPLDVGNRWSFTETRTSTNVYLFAFKKTHVRRISVALTVVEEREEDGLHLRRLARSEDGEEAASFWLYGFDGETVLASHGSTPFLAPGELAGTTSLLALPHQVCTWSAQPSGSFALPGPRVCSATRDRNNGVATAVTALFTAGMVLVDPNIEVSLDPFGSTPGAPPAPPAPPSE